MVVGYDIDAAALWRWIGAVERATTLQGAGQAHLRKDPKVALSSLCIIRELVVRLEIS
jgi:hypothetical protein